MEAAGGCAGKLLLFTAQSPVCCYSNSAGNETRYYSLERGKGGEGAEGQKEGAVWGGGSTQQVAKLQLRTGW